MKQTMQPLDLAEYTYHPSEQTKHLLKTTLKNRQKELNESIRLLEDATKKLRPIKFKPAAKPKPKKILKKTDLRSKIRILPARSSSDLPLTKPDQISHDVVDEQGNSLNVADIKNKIAQIHRSRE